MFKENIQVNQNKEVMENINAKTVKGSEAVILALQEENVKTIFGYPGGAIMPIYDELHDREDQIEHILVRHEQGAAHAAQAYAQVTGKVGVCFATSGPGATNLITGIANANIDSVPMVYVTAQIPSPLLGTDAFQETDMIGLSMPVTKWNFQITSADEIPDAFAKAFYIARTGRPGPVLLDITKDALLASTDFSYNKNVYIRSYNPVPQLNMHQINEAAAAINKAKKPMILVGNGVLISKAVDVLKQFAEKTGIPVASTLLGLSAFEGRHPLHVGMLGMHGHYAPNVLTNEADLIIAIGMRFDDRVTGDLKRYAKQAEIVHIEIDAAEIGKNVKVSFPVHGDAKNALAALIDKVEPNSHDEWVNKFRDLAKDESEKVINKDLYPESPDIKPAEVVHLISEKTQGDAIVITDVGQHQMTTARYFKFKEANSFITSGGLGTMGFGLPAGVGAKVGKPEKQTVAFLGDGGFQMTIQELGTILQYNIPVKIVVLNNCFLGMVRQWQDMFFEKRYASTPMLTPDFIGIAKAYGLKTKKVTEREDLNQAIDEMLASDTAYFLEVVVEKEANVFPMIVPGASVSEIRLE